MHTKMRDRTDTRARAKSLTDKEIRDRSVRHQRSGLSDTKKEAKKPKMYHKDDVR